MFAIIIGAVSRSSKLLSNVTKKQHMLKGTHFLDQSNSLLNYREAEKEEVGEEGLKPRLTSWLALPPDLLKLHHTQSLHTMYRVQLLSPMKNARYTMIPPPSPYAVAMEAQHLTSYYYSSYCHLHCTITTMATQIQDHRHTLNTVFLGT